VLWHLATVAASDIGNQHLQHSLDRIDCRRSANAVLRVLIAAIEGVLKKARVLSQWCFSRRANAAGDAHPRK